MKKVFMKSIIVFLFLFLTATAAQAAITTYNYVGNPFDNWLIYGYPLDTLPSDFPYSEGDHIEISFSLYEPLPPTGLWQVSRHSQDFHIKRQMAWFYLIRETHVIFYLLALVLRNRYDQCVGNYFVFLSKGTWWVLPRKSPPVHTVIVQRLRMKSQLGLGVQIQVIGPYR